jgi:GPH family glycoside/pentoside/hexuronide:cation symporter
MFKAIFKTDKEQGRVSFFQKASFGIGSLGEVIMSNIILCLGYGIYNIGLGVDAWLIGLAVSIPRFWEAFTDPVVGNISDNTQSRWGRRKPFILIGAIFTGVFCMLMWMPPGEMGATGYFIYFLVISILFFTMYAIFNVPFSALGFELSSDYDERTRVMGYKVFFGNMAVFCLPWAYKLCFVFGDNRDPVSGAKLVGLLYGGMIIMFGMFPALFCKENKTIEQNKIAFSKAFKCTLQNRSFLLLCTAIFAMIIGFYLAFPLLLYMNIAIVCPGNDELASRYVAYSHTTYGVVGIITAPLVACLGTRWGKRNTLMVGCVVVSIACLLSWVCFTPRYPLLQLVFSFLASPGMSCVWMLAGSSVADICDLDELKTGLRREGMYGAVFAWLIKCALAAVMAVGGFVLTWSGFVPKAAVQTPETINFLKIVFAIVPVFFLVLAFFLIWRFPLTKKIVMEVQEELKQRKINKAIVV